MSQYDRVEELLSYDIGGSTHLITLITWAALNIVRRAEKVTFIKRNEQQESSDNSIDGIEVIQFMIGLINQNRTVLKHTNGRQ